MEGKNTGAMQPRKKERKFGQQGSKDGISAEKSKCNKKKKIRKTENIAHGNCH